MAKSKQSKKLPAPSSEIGEGDFAINYTPRTGRPVRKARKSDLPFVDSAVAISDEESSDEEAIAALNSRSKKRKRSPSPPLSDNGNALEPVTDDEGDSGDDEVEVLSRKVPRISSLSTALPGLQYTIKDVVINVPLGHTGPIILHLGPDTAFQLPIISVQTPSARGAPKSRKRVTRKSASTLTPATHSGFLDLPAELRNEIYRLAFVGNAELRFANPTNFCRSAALLRTCHQVHDEARSIIYGENSFYFSRNLSRYGSFWEDDWKELGFRVGPVRRK